MTVESMTEDDLIHRLRQLAIITDKTTAHGLADALAADAIRHLGWKDAAREYDSIRSLTCDGWESSRESERPTVRHGNGS